MDSWLNFILELGVLCFFGFLYYFFQKKRIIRVDTEEIFNSLNEFNFELNTFLDGKETESFYSRLNEQTKGLESLATDGSIEDLITFMEKNQFQHLPKPIEEILTSIRTRLDFYKTNAKQ